MKQKKKIKIGILGALVSLTLIMAMSFGAVCGLSIISKAASYVAQVDDTQYTTFEDALNAWEPQTTLKLLDDVTMNTTKILATKIVNSYAYGDFTLDLNGKTITYEGSDSAISIGSDLSTIPKLTIIDSSAGGKISATNGTAIDTFSSKATVILNGGTISGTIGINGNGSGNQIQINDGAIVSGTSGAISGSGDIRIYGGKIVGSVTASSGSISGGYFTIKPENYIYYGCVVEEKASQTDWKYSDCGFRIIFPTNYNLSVGGIGVTSVNLSGEGWSFDPSTYELTLNGFSYSGNGSSAGYDSELHGFYQSGIAYTGNQALSISVRGSNTIISPEAGADLGCGIYSKSAISINGDGELSVTSIDGNVRYGINAPEVSVGDNLKNLDIIGKTKAIKGIVKNSVEGKGWTDTSGTSGEEVIEINNSGAELSFCKLHFPERKPGITFDTNSLTMTTGDSQKIEATVFPTDATVTWKTDSESIAKVDNTGRITAVGEGTTKITATITVGTTEYKAECTVTVTAASSESVPVIGISNLTDATEGESYYQELTASGAQPITWAITAGSLPDGLALGSDTGVISGTPTSTGTSVFTVTASNSYGSVSKELSITVQAGNTIVGKEGTAHDDEKTSVENDLAEVRALVSGVTPVDESDTVKLILNTDSKDEGNLSDDEKEAVDTIKEMAEANGLTVGSFVDLTLIYEVRDANGVQKARDTIKETSTKLKVKFPIPPRLQKSGRLFSIFRFHDSGAEIIGTGSGDAVDVDTDKFSMYAIAYEDGAAPAEDSEKKAVRPHTHTYAWDKVEATEDRDGELRYQCTECYDILVRVPLSAYYVFNANTVDKITKAKQGETVKITTDRWISFHKMVFDALAARPDVSLEVSFLDGEYKGNRVSFTIPAGADASDLFTENNFAGFMYLGNKYGLTAE